MDHYNLSHSLTEDDTTVLRRWGNLQLRLIKPTPRKVFVSNKIQASNLDAHQKCCFDPIEKKFINGTDVNPHLSKSLFREDYTDYLFTDWAIHHFHLNIDPDPNNPYFVKRSDKLLFLVLNDANAYFIDIRDHGENYVFAQKELLRT